MDRQLSALELSGKLIRICAGSRILRNQTAVGHVDNADSVRIFEKGCSSYCKLSNMLVKNYSPSHQDVQQMKLLLLMQYQSLNCVDSEDTCHFTVSPDRLKIYD